jgi:hypothetical protein
MNPHILKFYQTEQGMKRVYELIEAGCKCGHAVIEARIEGEQFQFGYTFEIQSMASALLSGPDGYIVGVLCRQCTIKHKSEYRPPHESPFPGSPFPGNPYAEFNTAQEEARRRAEERFRRPQEWGSPFYGNSWNSATAIDPEALQKWMEDFFQR